MWALFHQTKVYKGLQIFHQLARSRSKRNPIQFLPAHILAKLEDWCVQMTDTLLLSMNQPLLPSRTNNPCHTPILLYCLSGHSVVTEEQIIQAIHSFPNGSAGCPDGLRPQYLKDMVWSSADRASGSPLCTCIFHPACIGGQDATLNQTCIFCCQLDSHTKERLWS